MNLKVIIPVSVPDYDEWIEEMSGALYNVLLKAIKKRKEQIQTLEYMMT